MPLVIFGAAGKLLLSTALTVRTRLWWAPGVVMIGAGVGLARVASPGLGMASVALGAAAIATTRVVRGRARLAQSS